MSNLNSNSTNYKFYFRLKWANSKISKQNKNVTDKPAIISEYMKRV